MDEINPDMDNVDVCLVVGANDITNKAACDTPGCPIYGMPVIEVWRAKKTIFFKRSMGGGYADIENPVFFMENTDICSATPRRPLTRWSRRSRRRLRSAALPEPRPLHQGPAAEATDALCRLASNCALRRTTRATRDWQECMKQCRPCRECRRYAVPVRRLTPLVGNDDH
jgi:hypothetical protein